MGKGEQNSELVQEQQVDIIFFPFGAIEILQHNGTDLHHRPNTKLLQVLLALGQHHFCLLLLTADDLTQTRTGLRLLLRVEVLENVEENRLHLLLRLAVHYVVPVRVFYLLLAYLSVRLRCTSLQLQEVLVELLPHRIVADRIDHIF